MNKVILILRSASSAGKSTFAEYLEDLYNEAVWDEYAAMPEKNSVVCCADDFFTDTDGNYNWNPAKIGDAHKACKERFEKALKNSVGLIIVANTNTTEKEYAFYLEQGQNAGYMIFSLVIEKRHNKTNNHNVPLEALHRQATNIKNSLKLL